MIPTTRLQTLLAPVGAFVDTVQTIRTEGFAQYNANCLLRTPTPEQPWGDVQDAFVIPPSERLFWQVIGGTGTAVSCALGGIAGPGWFTTACGVLGATVGSTFPYISNYAMGKLALAYEQGRYHWAVKGLAETLTKKAYVNDDQILLKCQSIFKDQPHVKEEVILRLKDQILGATDCAPVAVFNAIWNLAEIAPEELDNLAQSFADWRPSNDDPQAANSIFMRDFHKALLDLVTLSHNGTLDLVSLQTSGIPTIGPSLFSRLSKLGNRPDVLSVVKFALEQSPHLETSRRALNEFYHHDGERLTVLQAVMTQMRSNNLSDGDKLRLIKNAKSKLQESSDKINETWQRESVVALLDEILSLVDSYSESYNRTLIEFGGDYNYEKILGELIEMAKIFAPSFFVSSERAKIFVGENQRSASEVRITRNFVAWIQSLPGFTPNPRR